MNVGDIYTEEIKISVAHIENFAKFSGDYNPVHFDESEARAQGFNGRIAHGMISASFFSKIFANNFPGPGTIYLSQSIKFHAPVYIDEVLLYRLEVIAQKEGKPIFTVKAEAVGSDKLLRTSGEAIIRAKT
jgi:3-hydroxybutyryl-CoA dehydratase